MNYLFIHHRKKFLALFTIERVFFYVTILSISTVNELEFQHAEISICSTRLSNAKFFLIQANETIKGLYLG
jgi:hypothetical protein